MIHFLLLQKLARAPLKNLSVLRLSFPVNAIISSALPNVFKGLSDGFHVVPSGFRWFPLVILGYPWLSLVILAYPCLSLLILAYPCLSLLIRAYPCLSLLILTYPCLSLVIPGYIRFQYM